MYTRRKVFSIANDYDYNDYYERLYSEAFEDGVDYAERMFAEEEKKSFLDTLKGLPAKAKEKIINQWNKYAKEEGKGVNWKNIGNRTAMVAAPVAALAGLGYGGYKLATRKKEKEYSEGFEDGFDFAVQKMYTTEAEANKRAAALQKRMAKEGTDLEKNTLADFQAFLDKNKKSYKSSTGGYDQVMLDIKNSKDYKDAAAGIKSIKKRGGNLTPEEKASLSEWQNMNAAMSRLRGDTSGITQANAIYDKGIYGKSNSIDASNIAKYDPKSKLGKDKGYATSKGRGFEQFDKNGNVIVSKKEKEAIEAELKKRQGKEAAELVAAKMAPLNKMKSLKNRWKWGAIGTGVLGAGATTAALLANRRRDND